MTVQLPTPKLSEGRKEDLAQLGACRSAADSAKLFVIVSFAMVLFGHKEISGKRSGTTKNLWGGRGGEIFQ